MTLLRTLTLAGYLFGAMGIAAAVAAAGTVVSQKGKAFSEKEMTLAIGDSITFKNEDDVKHNILIKKMDYNSGVQEPGNETTVTFDTAGKFKVRCGIHPKMKMKVVVN